MSDCGGKVFKMSWTRAAEPQHPNVPITVRVTLLVIIMMIIILTPIMTVTIMIMAIVM